jgi:glycosyltransferase involved in cell wall biosynthesis
LTKEIVFVNQYRTQIFLQLIEGFSKSGWETHLLTGKSGATERILANTRYTYLKSYNRKSFMSRLISWIVFTIQSIAILLMKRQHAVLFLVTNPPFMPWVGKLINKLKGQKYFLLIYDVYPEALYHAGFVGKNSLVFKTWSSLNKKAFNSCSGVITLSDAMRSELPTFAGNIKIIPNWADTTAVRPMEKSKNPFVKEHGLEDKTVLLYSGNFGLTHDFESPLKAAEMLSNREDIQFVFIGDGARSTMIKAYAREYKNITWLPFQSEDLLSFTFAAADLGLVTLDQSMEQVSVPSKTYYYMAAGCALVTIASENSILAQIVERHQNGICISPGNVDAIRVFIEQMADNPKRLLDFKIRSLEASKEYSPSNAQKYVAYIEKKLSNVQDMD